MTDEERQKLVEHLRAGRPNQFERKAADEIERLAKENGRLTQALIDKLATKDMPDFTKIDWNMI